MMMWHMRSTLRTLGRTATPWTPTLSPPYGDMPGALDPMKSQPDDHTIDPMDPHPEPALW